MSDVHLLALGGTISMRPGPEGARPVATAERIAQKVEGIGVAEDMALVGGSEVDFDLMERVARRAAELAAEGVRGLVVTTGTDSIEEMASWLAYRERWPMPVVVTGAMVPGERLDSDGPANLADAVAVAASGADVDPVVTFGGRVWAGREVLKVSGVERDAFAAPGRGPLGVVGGGQVRWHRRLGRRPAHGAPTGPLVPVPIVVAALGDDGALVEFAGSRHRAVVIAANGAGNLPPGQAAAVRGLLAARTLVVLTTRAPDARVAPVYGYPGGSAGLVEAGVVFANGLSPHRARLLLTLGLAQGRRPAELAAMVASEADPA